MNKLVLIAIKIGALFFLPLIHMQAILLLFFVLRKLCCYCSKDWAIIFSSIVSHAGYVIWISFRTCSKSFALLSMIVGCSWKLVKKQKICGRLWLFSTSTDNFYPGLYIIPLHKSGLGESGAYFWFVINNQWYCFKLLI